jgi:hypothetical protein
MPGQELLEEQARAGIRIAIDEANGGIEQSLERRYAKRVAAFDHQAHLAGHETDDPMNARRQPALGGGDAPLAQLALRQMHARQVAPVMRQRRQRVLVADVA